MAKGTSSAVDLENENIAVINQIRIKDKEMPCSANITTKSAKKKSTYK